MIYTSSHMLFILFYEILVKKEFFEFFFICICSLNFISLSFDIFLRRHARQLCQNTSLRSFLQIRTQTSRYGSICSYLRTKLVLNKRSISATQTHGLCQASDTLKISGHDYRGSTTSQTATITTSTSSILENGCRISHLK